MEYSKGEWKASHPLYGATDIVVDVTPQRTDMLASIKWGSNIPESEQRANAQLIASAPDMYEVLKKAFTDPQYVWSGEWYQPAKDALRKAEGKNE